MTTTEKRAELATKLEAVGRGFACVSGNDKPDAATAMKLGAAGHPELYRQYCETLPGSAPVKTQPPEQR